MAGQLENIVFRKFAHLSVEAVIYEHPAHYNHRSLYVMIAEPEPLSIFIVCEPGASSNQSESRVGKATSPSIVSVRSSQSRTIARADDDPVSTCRKTPSSSFTPQRCEFVPRVALDVITGLVGYVPPTVNTIVPLDGSVFVTVSPYAAASSNRKLTTTESALVNESIGISPLGIALYEIPGWSSITSHFGSSTSSHMNSVDKSSRRCAGVLRITESLTLIARISTKNTVDEINDVSSNH